MSPGPRTCVGLFAGIGGIELGLREAGLEASLFCEIDPHAQLVLGRHFPGVPVVADIRELDALPNADLVTAGFPCQDLSQAGRTAGIRGARSGLVGHLFELLERANRKPPWLLLENVPFMLRLEKGRAMDFLTRSLESLGYRWAYRTVDTRCFGLPQRRQRVLLLASTEHDPRPALLGQDHGPRPVVDDGRSPCGFYWTEGTRGLGWALDAVPTLKGGSAVGIPSPPAIWMRQDGGEIVVPEIRDAERLQGFDADWTLPALARPKTREGARWKLVGNAVSVPVGRWVGERLVANAAYDDSRDPELRRDLGWPHAAHGDRGVIRVSSASLWPVALPYRPLGDFLEYPTKPLSLRAASGFLRRAEVSGLRFANGFLDAVRSHVRRMETGRLPTPEA